MFAVIFAMMYGFCEKRIQQRILVDLLYFLSAGLLWTIITCLLALIMFFAEPVNPDFMKIVPGVSFALSLIFTFFPWIFGLRNSKK